MLSLENIRVATGGDWSCGAVCCCVSAKALIKQVVRRSVWIPYINQLAPITISEPSGFQSFTNGDFSTRFTDKKLHFPINNLLRNVG